MIYEMANDHAEDTIHDQTMTVPPAITVSVVNNFNYEQFVLPGADGDVYKVWNDWHQGLIHILEASNTPEEKKFSSLLAYGGKDLRNIYSSINNGTIPKSEKFETAIEKLEEFFKPKQHATYLRVKFWEMTKRDDETIDDFVSKLNEKKKHCNFGTTKQEIEDFVMTDKFLLSMPQYIKQELIKDKKLNFESAVRQAKELESSRNQARELSQPVKEKQFFGSVNRLNDRRLQSHERRPFAGNHRLGTQDRRNTVCFRCNNRNHTSESERCPARNAHCFDCQARGHWANTAFCKKRKDSSREYESNPKRRRVNYIKDDENEIVCNVNSAGVSVVCQIEGLYVKMLVDSGTNRNIIDERTYKLMMEKGFKPRKQLENKRIRFVGYGNTELKQVTAFEAKISCEVNLKRYDCMSTFYVIRNGAQPLLCKETAEILGILFITVPDRNYGAINAIGDVQDIDLPEVKDKVPFPKIKGVKIHLAIKEGFAPVQLNLRRTPVALTDMVKSKLLELEQQDIIERVIVYRSGKTNIADPFSRLPIRTDDAFDEDSDVFINSVLSSVAVDIREVEQASREDGVLQVLKEAIDNRCFDKEEILEYKFCQNELAYVGNIITRGTLIVVPASLQERFLELAHEGHLGETMMKRRLRARCWFPKMDSKIEKFVKSCHACLLVSAPCAPEPLSRKKLPNKPFMDIAIDFLGPLPSGEFLLVVVDYFSRWMDVKIMNIITSEATIQKLEDIFLYQGYPISITLDNGRQFVSTKFKEYCTEHKIILNHTAPYWPQANGEVERQNRTLLKRLKIGNANGNWKTELRNFLIAYNSTPHSTTNRSPNELMGREVRTKIPQLADIEQVPIRDEVVERDFLEKEKGKERADESRKAKNNDIQIGDNVLQKNLIKENKLTTSFGQKEFKVVDRQGPVVTLSNEENGEHYERIVTHVKKIPNTEKASTDIPLGNSQSLDENKRPQRTIKVPKRYID
uniref:RNA-directed DNA polymerase n=1 Tax=Culicoides sonorensis TaxID=179676 RepID=A0A336LRD2_CULSO